MYIPITVPALLQVRANKVCVFWKIYGTGTGVSPNSSFLLFQYRSISVPFIDL